MKSPSIEIYLEYISDGDNSFGDIMKFCTYMLDINKLGLSSAKLSRDKFGCLEVIFEIVSKDNLK